MSIQLRDGTANQPVDHILEDLLVRFVINCPAEDLSSIERVFFQVEEAQWFYTDFMRQLDLSLPSMKMKLFAPRLLSKCPLLWKWGDPADALSRFGKYKSTIPVRGIALLNKEMTRMVLVQGTERALWSFPRGKISKDEDDLVCAVREVKEETGFDAREYVNEKDVMERTVHGKNFKIYLARNVPEDFPFEPLARNEIALIQWFDIKLLQKSVKLSPNKYFAVDPFMKPLTRWINRMKGVVNEDELKRQAEVKLKELMGLLVDSAPGASADAGRELLDILQGVAKPAAPQPPVNSNGSDPQVQPPQYIQMTVPHHLQSFYAGMGQIPQFFNQNPNGYVPMPQSFPAPQYNGGFFPNQVPPPLVHGQTPTQPPRQLHTQAPPQFLGHTPQPQVASPAANTNSKELLSILKGGPAKPQPAETPAKKEQSRAGEFLQMLSKKPESPAASPDAAPKKILLKRDKSSLENDASATLLGLLGKKPAPAAERPREPVTAPQPQSSSNASAELLGLINRNKPAEPAPALPSEAEQNVPKSDHKASAELLGLINRKPAQKQKADPVVEDLEPRPIPNSMEFLKILKENKLPQEDKKASNELLDILNQPKMPVRIAKREQGTPVDLKSVLNNQGPQSPSSEVSNATLILSTLNRKSTTPQSRKLTPKPQPQPEDFEDFENFEDFDDFNGESHNDIYNSIANTHDDSDDYDEIEEPTQASQPIASPGVESSAHFGGNQGGFFNGNHNGNHNGNQPVGQPVGQPGNIAGNHLLLLLNGGKPPTSNYQDTYGSSEQASAPYAASPQHQNAPNNGADFLRVLGRRPPTEPTKSSDGRDELLSILKGPRFG